MNDPKKPKTYPESTPQEELWNSITHGIGIPIGILVLYFLVAQALTLQNGAYLAAVIIYALSFTWTYTTSTLYHLAHQAPARVRNKLHLLDHTAIYLFIAGTYTPIALFALPSDWSRIILVAVWILAIGGVLIKIYSIGKFRKLSLVFYLLMGWLIIIAAKPLLISAPTGLILWIAIGGAFYSLGTIFFSLRRIAFAHVIWHLCVLGGSLSHFYAIYHYLPGLVI